MGRLKWLQQKQRQNRLFGVKSRRQLSALMSPTLQKRPARSVCRPAEKESSQIRTFACRRKPTANNWKESHMVTGTDYLAMPQFKVRGLDGNSLLRLYDIAQERSAKSPSLAERERACRARDRIATELRRRNLLP